MPQGPVRVFRTYRGDFRLNERDAIRRGLLPAPGSDALPVAVVQRMKSAAVVQGAIDAAIVAYRDLDDVERARFLEEVSKVSDRELRNLAEEGYVPDAEVPTVASVTADLEADAALVEGQAPAVDPEGQAAADTLVDAAYEEAKAKVLAAVSDGRVGDVTREVAGSVVLARVALESELAGRARPSLVAALEQIIRDEG